MASLTIFGNFLIDTDENLQRMKDSFNSFSSICAERWVINIRGRLRIDAMAFLATSLGSSLVSFDLNSPEGWFHDSRRMLDVIASTYVLFWIEDHINLENDMGVYRELLQELEASNIDFMYYSFFWTTKRYEHLPQNRLRHISWFDNDQRTFERVIEKTPGAYIIGACGLFKTGLFKRIVMTDDPLQAIKWSPLTPFNFEKSSHDRHWLPLRMACPNKELFVSIDDDSVAPGSCLISRGLYPGRVMRPLMGSPISEKPLQTTALMDPQSLLS
jgi:hypothetical protein